jgi:hypothetical protein
MSPDDNQGRGMDPYREAEERIVDALIVWFVGLVLIGAALVTVWEHLK